jgi:D-alanyl-D-alanine carboxypeptidase (penicillin-binding protein 5/6)
VQVRGTLVEAFRADAPRQPASLAKLALALAALQGPGAPDRVVVVSPRAAGMPPSRLGLRAGERVRADDLLRALVVASSNDACIALAESMAGGVSAAVAAMNGVAARLGMQATRFADACGFDHSDQGTTAADLVRLANAAMQSPVIAAAAAERSVTVSTVDGKRTYRAATSNALLARGETVVGLKTGLTRGAGASAIVVARERDVEILVVVLGARDRWHAAERLVAHGFSRAYDTAR